MKLRLAGERPKILALHEAAGKPKGSEWEIMAVAAGFSANYLEGTGLRMYHDAEDLKAAVKLFEGRPVYALKFLSEQYKPEGSQSGKYSHTPADVRDVLGDRGLIRNVAGYLKNCRFGKASDGTEGIIAELHLLPSSAELASKLAELWGEGVSDFVGFSYDAYTVPEFAEVAGEPVCKLKIQQVNSLDVVTTPAAGGRLLRAVAEIQKDTNQGSKGMNPKLKALLASFAYSAASKKPPEAALARLMQSAEETEAKAAAADVLQAVGAELKTQQAAEEVLASIEQIAQMIAAGDAQGALAGLEALKAKLAAPAEMSEDEKAKAEAEKKKAEQEASALKAKQEAEASAKTETEKRLAEIEAKQAALADTQTAQALEAELKDAALPEASKARLVQELRREFSGGKPLDRKRLVQAIESEQKYLSALSESGLPVSMHTFQTRDSRADAILALQGMVSEREFENEKKERIAPFISFREAYRAFMGRDVSDPRLLPKAFLGGPSASGFHSLEQGFKALGGRPLRVKDALPLRFRALQEIVTIDLASIFANVLHNALLISYEGDDDGLTDWKKITKTVNLSDLYAHKFSRMSKGRGAVPAVNEGGTYTELSDPVDEDIDLTASKFGGFAVVTHEAIMKDRLDKVAQVPAQLAYSIKQDIYREVFDYFVNNDAIYDGVKLIHAATHVNGAASGGSAFSPATAKTARRSMMDMSAYGDSRDVLGMRNLPKYYLVPNELEEMAKIITESDRLLQVAAGSGGYTAGQILQGDGSVPNILKGSGASYIVVPYWTDADNWFAVADPAKVPGILMGFLNGDETPEIFTEAADSGVDFSADKKRWKVRQFRDSAVVDYRPIYGQFV